MILGIGSRTQEESYQYFSTLKCDTIIKLYKIYSLDFILFEYDQHEFLKRCIR